MLKRMKQYAFRIGRFSPISESNRVPYYPS